MGSSHEVIVRLSEKWKHLPNLHGFGFEDMVISDIRFDTWKNTISFWFIEHDDETLFIANLSRFLQAWNKRDNHIWKIDKIFWGGLEDWLYPEDWNNELHDLFPYVIDQEWGGKKLVSSRDFLEDVFFPVNKAEPKTRVVNKLHETFDVFIGRPSKWGNPFVINKDGTREQVIAKYEEYLRNKPELLKFLYELKGQTLGCFCKPLACHGDILVKLIEELKI